MPSFLLPIQRLTLKAQLSQQLKHLLVNAAGLRIYRWSYKFIARFDVRLIPMTFYFSFSIFRMKYGQEKEILDILRRDI